MASSSSDVAAEADVRLPPVVQLEGDQPAESERPEQVPEGPQSQEQEEELPASNFYDTQEGNAYDSASGTDGLVPESDPSDVSSDADSALGSVDYATSTTSVRTEIRKHIEENGRLYHSYKEGKYVLPNDEQEQERLDLQHALFRLSLRGKLCLAPIDTIPLGNAMDFATGTGIWAIDFADEHPDCEVLGTDLSAIQPDFVPQNCRFEVHDAEDDWNFGRSFDYIHGRALVSCFADPSAVIQKAYDSLAPGGYLELQDAIMPFLFINDPPPPPEQPLRKWSTLITEAAARAGRPWTNVQHYRSFMERAGFVDIQEKRQYWPTNPWPKGKHMKRIALYFQTDMLEGMEGFTLKLLINFMGWTKEEVQVLLAGVRRDFKNPSLHGYLTVSFIWGRKPL